MRYASLLHLHTIYQATTDVPFQCSVLGDAYGMRLRVVAVASCRHVLASVPSTIIPLRYGLAHREPRRFRDYGFHARSSPSIGTMPRCLNKGLRIVPSMEVVAVNVVAHVLSYVLRCNRHRSVKAPLIPGPVEESGFVRAPLHIFYEHRERLVCMRASFPVRFVRLLDVRHYDAFRDLHCEGCENAKRL